jgi:hypothetical protein
VAVAVGVAVGDEFGVPDGLAVGAGGVRGTEFPDPPLPEHAATNDAQDKNMTTVKDREVLVVRKTCGRRIAIYLLTAETCRNERRSARSRHPRWRATETVSSAGDAHHGGHPYPGPPFRGPTRGAIVSLT